MVKTDQPLLAVDPAVHRFNTKTDEDALQKLSAQLDLHVENTENFTLTSPNDIFIHDNCKVQGTYQLTDSALSQLCSKLAPGLSQAVLDLSGVRPRVGRATLSQQTDSKLCARMINEIIKKRFNDGLLRCGMILDHRTNTIEGIVGSRYQYFPNKDLFDRVVSFIDDLDVNTEFCEAILAGRRLSLRFKNVDPLFDIPTQRRTNEPFFGGYHFSNSETGECSVKAAALIIRQWCDNKAISEFREGGKLCHVRGTKFDQRFQALLDQVNVKTQEATKFKGRVLEMLDTNLGLGGTNADNEERKKTLYMQLQHQKLNQGFCTTVVNRVLASGSYEFNALPRTANPLSLYQQRTEYDLFNAITHEAKTTNLDTQEKAEQVAYKMLTGKFKIK